jgi:hypothetical protein
MVPKEPSLLLSWDMHLQVVEKGKYATRNLSNYLIDAFGTNFHRFEPANVEPSPTCQLGAEYPADGSIPVHLKRLCLPFYSNMSKKGNGRGNHWVANVKTNHFTHFTLLHQGEQRYSITLEAFLNFFRSSPVLESLLIEDAGPIVKKGASPEIMDIIDMPNVRYVRYKDSSESRPQNGHASSFYWLLT